MKSILIIGGYGNFGKRIVSELSERPNTTLLIAGRSRQAAESLKQQLLMNASAKLKAIALDIESDNLERNLRLISPDIVIHTSGPFQGQNYRVAECCINIGAHYIDLSDDSDFVTHINQLNEKAKENRVMVIAGASSVPGLSSCVVGSYQSSFSVIDQIDIAIAPGNKAERGVATVKGILSGAGKPFDTFVDGFWRKSFGWMNLRLKNFGGVVGRRWLANVNVPDLRLFPERYKVTKKVRFQAGLELTFLHLSLYLLAALAKARIIKNVVHFAQPMIKASQWFQVFGSDVGVMEVTLTGRNLLHQDKIIRWQLVAEKGVGPHIPTIPTIPAIILAHKLLDAPTLTYGAMPCLGLFSMEEFLPYAEKMGIDIKVQIIG